jgi:hypothetical protein
MSTAGYIDEHYQFLLEYFPGNIMFLRFKTLWYEVVKIVKSKKLEEKIRIDEESFQMMVLDYFTDIARVRYFQQIDHANVNKIYGYQLYWFLRRHPIQIVQSVPDNFDINEKVAIALFLPKILRDTGIEYSKASQDSLYKTELSDFVNLLFYNFKYRTYTQQSLELMIKAFSCSHLINRETIPPKKE